MNLTSVRHMIQKHLAEADTDLRKAGPYRALVLGLALGMYFGAVLMMVACARVGG